MSTDRLRAMAFLFAASTGLGLSLSCSDGGGDGGDGGSGGPTVAGYCEARCDFEIACEGEAESNRASCVEDCTSYMEADLASFDGVCVAEWLTSGICVAEASTQNGCDDDQAEDVTCAEEILAKLDCYCSDMCVPGLLGNGACDGACNSAECNYDDGDCG